MPLTIGSKTEFIALLEESLAAELAKKSDGSNIKPRKEKILYFIFLFYLFIHD